METARVKKGIGDARLLAAGLAAVIDLVKAIGRSAARAAERWFVVSV